MTCNKQSINDECLFYKNKGSKFNYVSTHLNDLVHCINYPIMANELKNQLIKTYMDIQYHVKTSSYLGMTINRSVDLGLLGKLAIIAANHTLF